MWYGEESRKPRGEIAVAELRNALSVFRLVLDWEVVPSDLPRLTARMRWSDGIVLWSNCTALIWT